MEKALKPLTLTVCFCLLILIIKNQFTYLLLNHSTYGMPALIEQKQIDNLFIGSSMFRQGIDIHTLENKSACSNWILAYNGNQPVLEYFQLENLINHNMKIKNLYIDMYVYSAWEAPEINDEKLFLEIGISEKWKLWDIINTASPGLKFEAFWRMFVSSNNELLLTWPINSIIINKQFHQGGTLINTSGASSDELAISSVPEISEEMHPTQKYYLKKLIQLAKEHSINIIFVETPKYQVVGNDASYLSAMKMYADFLESEQVPFILTENTWSSQYADNGVSYYPFDIYDADYFMDSIHLSSLGRKTFTSAISLFYD